MSENGGGGPAGTLAGLKVVEFAQVVAGPLAGSLLAYMGADVVHVEAPGLGDPARPGRRTPGWRSVQATESFAQGL